MATIIHSTEGRVTDGEIILWQRLDAPGHDIATITRQPDGWLVTGVAAFVQGATPCRVDYDIRCDARWVTRLCRLRASIGAKRRDLVIERQPTGEWTVDGDEVAALRRCDDIDLGCSPVTNWLPIRRLTLAIGARASVNAAWVRFPELTVEVLEQTYTRVDRTHYQYESAGGAFRRELSVDAFGCVVDYPGLWRAEATAPLSAPVT